MGRVPRLISAMSSKLAAVAILLAAVSGSALAQSANFREAFLVRQDSSDCQNGNVSAQDPSKVGGTVSVVRNNDRTSSVKGRHHGRAEHQIQFLPEMRARPRHHHDV